MHSIIKSSFYIIFIVLAIFVSAKLLLKSKGNKQVLILGLTTLFLGIGEGFHIIPRILEIFSSDAGTYESYIETGRFISSISIIVVYLLLFWFWRVYYKVEDKKYMEIVLLVTGFIGVILSVVLKDSTTTSLILLRNLPLVIIGLFVIVLYKLYSTVNATNTFKYLWLALLLSLVFTLGFELLRFDLEFLVILMMPKTLMFIWVVMMGYLADKKDLLIS